MALRPEGKQRYRLPGLPGSRRTFLLVYAYAWAIGLDVKQQIVDMAMERQRYS